MNVGEMGNFSSYAFAPASVVAPLGTVSSAGCGECSASDPTHAFPQFALIANCAFAPLMLGEQFRKVSSCQGRIRN